MIELLVVMLLVTIVLAVTIPRFDVGMMQDPQKQLSRWMINTTRALRSAAMEKQMVHVLVIDLERNRLFTIREDMDDEAMTDAAAEGFSLSRPMRLVNVQFPDKERVSSGTVPIHFHPAGYSDQVMIQLEHRNAQRFSFKLEPLLPRVKLLEEWISY